jgi:hypothetical protein
VQYTTAPPPSNGKLGPFVGVARQMIDLDKKTYTNYLSVPGDINKEWISARLEATFEEWDGEFLSSNSSSNSSESGGDDGHNAKRVGDIINTADTITVRELQSNWMDSLAAIMFRRGSDNSKKPIDYGADSWKVDFKTLTIKIFGFPLIQKKFKTGTSRIWQMSYLDGTGTRIGKYR